MRQLYGRPCLGQVDQCLLGGYEWFPRGPHLPSLAVINAGRKPLVILRTSLCLQLGEIMAGG